MVRWIDIVLISLRLEACVCRGKLVHTVESAQYVGSSPFTFDSLPDGLIAMWRFHTPLPTGAMCPLRIGPTHRYAGPSLWPLSLLPHPKLQNHHQVYLCGILGKSYTLISTVVGSLAWVSAKEAPVVQINPKSAWGRGPPAALQSAPTDPTQSSSGANSRNGSRGKLICTEPHLRNLC